MKQGCFVSLFRTVLTLLVICPVALFSAVTSGSDFLKIPRSARAIALGESYTAVIDDPTAIDYNPAALNTINNIAIAMMYQSWIDNSYGLNLAGGYRIRDIVIGASVYWFNYGGLTEYDYYGIQSGQYNPNDLNIKAAVSIDSGILFDMLRGLSFGASLSVIDRNLINESLWGFSFDAGINYKTTIGKIFNISDPYMLETFGKLPVNAGFAVQNIGFAADTVTPVKFSGGLAASLFPDFILSLDLSKDVYNTPWMFKMGAEYTFLEMISLRLGFNLGKDTGNLSMGLGIRYPMLFNTLRFDYAFTPLGILGNNHNFSLYGEFKFDIKSEDYYQKGIYYFNKKDYLKTREMWRQARNLDPESETVGERLAMIEEIVKVFELDNVPKDITNKVARLNQLMLAGQEGLEPGVIVREKKVTFIYRSISRLIQSVAVTGDFNDWSKTGIPMKQGTNEWRVTLELEPGVHQYKYLIDGTYSIQDPANSQSTPDGQGGRNSVFTVAGERDTNRTPRSIRTNTNSAAAEPVKNARQSLTNLAASQTNLPSAQTNRIKEQKVIYTNINLKETIRPDPGITNVKQNDVRVPNQTNQLKPKVVTITNKIYKRAAPKKKTAPTK